MKPDTLPLEYTITTPAAPVQAEGRVAGRRFYFRARHDEWRFVVAEHPDVDPAMLDADASARGLGWWAEGAIGAAREHRASRLCGTEVHALLEQCARRYLAERTS